MTERTRSESTFGGDLRSWRTRRGLSQLELAGRAEVSQRHLSFLETGRSRPSRAMVLRLSRALEMPLRAQNALLAAAGMAPEHPEASLEHLPGVVAMVDRTLSVHEPHPGFAVDGRGRVVGANAPAEQWMSRDPEQGADVIEALVDGVSPDPPPVERLGARTIDVDGRSMFATITSIVAAEDVTAAELRVVLLWPAGAGWEDGPRDG